jgi:hypothetical protein
LQGLLRVYGLPLEANGGITAANGTPVKSDSTQASILSNNSKNQCNSAHKRKKLAVISGKNLKL